VRATDVFDAVVNKLHSLRYKIILSRLILSKSPLEVQSKVR
jgi:hypothetical protein